MAVSCGAISDVEPLSRCNALCVRLRVAIPGRDARDLFDVLAVSLDTVVAMDIFRPGSWITLLVGGKY